MGAEGRKNLWKNETVVSVVDSWRVHDKPTAPAPKADPRICTTGQTPAGWVFVGVSSTHITASLWLATGFNGGWAGPYRISLYTHSPEHAGLQAENSTSE